MFKLDQLGLSGQQKNQIRALREQKNGALMTQVKDLRSIHHPPGHPQGVSMALAALAFLKGT